MKYKLIFSLVLLILISSCTTGQVIKENPKEGPFLVIKVVDGDTLEINTRERIRLSGINTPEKKECYYKEAKDALTNLTLNKTVYIQQDITNKDKYGRLLRYIYLDDLLVNEYLVENGYARVFDKYKEDTSKYYSLKAIEVEAIRLNKGVWSC